MEETAENIQPAENAIPVQPVVAADQPKWWIDEGVPGAGDRPQWLPDKYKNVKEAVNSGLELEKKLGTAPVNDYDFGEYGEHFDKNHEAFKELQDFAKEKRVPQEVLSKMLESFTKYGKSLIPNADAEKAKLGPDADKQIEVLNNWAKSNLSPEAAEALFESMSSASSIKAMLEVRAKMIGTTNPSIPNGAEQTATSAETVQALEKELSVAGNFEKYKTDETYRDDYKRRLSQATARQNGAGYVNKDGAGGY